MASELPAFSKEIPAWVIESGVQESFETLPYSIAVITTPHGHVGLYANPLDQRCYRMIARLLVKEQSQLHLNQFHSLEESLAVSTAIAVVKQVVYHKTGLFVQSMHLGNNAMSSSNNDVLLLGKEDEPYFYHEHLLARGDPTRSYFSGAPVLGGPPLGTAFAAQGRHLAPTRQHLAAMVAGFKTVLDESEQEGIWERAGCSVDTT